MNRDLEPARPEGECTTAEGGRAFQGIRYLSRLGDDIHNWAICEPATIETLSVEKLIPSDPDLKHAMELFSLVLLGAS